jgi:hypothetical protein
VTLKTSSRSGRSPRGRDRTVACGHGGQGLACDGSARITL